MLKTYPVRRFSRENNGEYVLGLKDLATHACYLIYGELKPGESGRVFCPGVGHEEILVVVSGDLEVEGEPFTGRLPEGEAIHLRDEESCMLANLGESRAVYVMAGGHSGKEH